jgi:predicted nucleic acid-binding protein
LKILVDSSVWIDFLRGRHREEFAAAVKGYEVVTCLPIIQEVLQGIGDPTAFQIASVAFAELPLLEDPLTRRIFDDAIQLYREARRASITIRSSVDCLIAACALRHEAVVLHTDRDYTHLARVVPLKALRFG